MMTDLEMHVYSNCQYPQPVVARPTKTASDQLDRMRVQVLEDCSVVEVPFEVTCRTCGNVLPNLEEYEVHLLTSERCATGRIYPTPKKAELAETPDDSTLIPCEI